MIPFIKPYYDEEDFQAIREVLQSGWVAQGPKVEEFEEAAAKYLDIEHVISTTNCTMALTLALMALDIGPGDEVILSDFTFPATAIAVTNVGATPVLVDVKIGSYNTDVSLIERAITDRTVAIIPVHIFGLGCDMNPIVELAMEHELKIIEDAACALGTNIRKPSSAGTTEFKKAGTFGHIGCFSLQASKGITTGEGGLICTADDDLAERMRRLSCFGDERTYRRGKNMAPFFFHPKANNYKMSDITAALALSQLKKINRLTSWRIKVASEWDHVINNDPFLRKSIIIKPDIVHDGTHIYQSYVAVCKNGERPAVMEYMKRKGFATGIGTHACHKYPNIFGGIESLAVSNYLYNNSISFPRYYGLEVKEEWYGHNSKP